ncbi:MAG: PrgI family protein [Oscillospiraceae bacterium]|nr:PrgI family protein [Oscillospiraceae bacterium]
MNYETYYIPANFTDAGRVFGLFEIRNVIEALLLGAPVLLLCFNLLPFKLTTKIIVTLVIFIPIAGFALIGVSDDSLSRWLKAWAGWRKKRRVLTYRGEADYGGFERAYLRRGRQRAR